MAAWVQAWGTLGAVIVALVLAGREVRRERHDRAEEARRAAAQVVAAVSNLGSARDGYGSIVVHLDNYATSVIREVVVSVVWSGGTADDRADTDPRKTWFGEGAHGMVWVPYLRPKTADGSFQFGCQAAPGVSAPLWERIVIFWSDYNFDRWEMVAEPSDTGERIIGVWSAPRRIATTEGVPAP